VALGSKDIPPAASRAWFDSERFPNAAGRSNRNLGAGPASASRTAPAPRAEQTADGDDSSPWFPMSWNGRSAQQRSRRCHRLGKTAKVMDDGNVCRKSAENVSRCIAPGQRGDRDDGGRRPASRGSAKSAAIRCNLTSQTPPSNDGPKAASGRERPAGDVGPRTIGTWRTTHRPNR